MFLKDVLEWTGPRGGLLTTERCGLCFSSMTEFPGHPLPVSLECPRYSKHSFFFSGFALAGTEHCIGLSILPWVGLQQLSRRATESDHGNMPHPLTWDDSDGPLQTCPRGATSQLVPKERLRVYSGERGFSSCSFETVYLLTRCLTSVIASSEQCR